MARFGHCFDLFGCDQLAVFELGNLLLIGFDDRRALGIHNPIDKLLDLFIEIRQFSLQCCPLLDTLALSYAPRLLEHRLGDIKEPLCWRHALQEFFKRPFDLGARD
ncbi:hypothetical protein BKI51_02410 [Alphaproteobacteria bacterium AO1-B]|nr:hypothetical protein BKI51_02410 [Alphaproteobacteria bacterium AO1-B]